MPTHGWSWRSLLCGRSHTPRKGRTIATKAEMNIISMTSSVLMADVLDVSPDHAVAIIKGAQNVATIRSLVDEALLSAFYASFTGGKFDLLEPSLEWRCFEIYIRFEVNSTVSTQTLMAIFFGRSAGRLIDRDSSDSIIGTGVMSISMRFASTRTAWY